MPRLVNSPSKYSLHKPSGLAKVKFQGRVNYLGKYGKPESREAYGRFVASLPKRSDSPTPTNDRAPGSMTLVSEVVLRLYHHAKAYYTKDGLPTGEHITVPVRPPPAGGKLRRPARPRVRAQEAQEAPGGDDRAQLQHRVADSGPTMGR
jgi:hypothetical protein